MTFPWNKADQVSAEQVQLEAREEQRKFALAALDTALQEFAPLFKEALCDYCQEFSGDRLRKIQLAIREAIEQLEGRATP